jgi:8-oxo-dGTP pyrophosphatase MutT (NUDIX family)
MTEKQAIAPAATILLVRDAPGLEVLMVKRHHQIDFASGALVFPGGKVAEEDRHPDWEAYVDAPDDLAPEERALRVASIREAFEESGVLLARSAHARGAGEPFAPPGACAELHSQRQALGKGEIEFLPLIRDAGLVLALDGLSNYAHWITPEGVGRRFDTYFFIAAAPPDQAANCDGWEAVEATWIAPRQALADGRAGLRQIIFPTRLNLERLALSERAAEAIAAARARPIVTVQPKIIVVDGKRTLSIPAEAGYAVTHEPLEGNRP